MSSKKSTQKVFKTSNNFSKKNSNLSPILKNEILKEIKLKKVFTTLSMSCLLNISHSLILHVVEEMVIRKHIVFIQYSTKEKIYILLNPNDI
mmetsp:Transcript_34356/g.66928  ORF Transcript_34356/g.66928 Transcript_34356/m.66928 type:complete len:92 (+) Transcript_34356:630-905(+)